MPTITDSSTGSRGEAGHMMAVLLLEVEMHWWFWCHMTTAAPVTSVVTRCWSPRRYTLTTDTLIQTHFHHQGHTQCTETDLETEDWSI